jgi:hypothetical protein
VAGELLQSGWLHAIFIGLTLLVLTLTAYFQLVLAWASNALSAQKLKDADCLACHGDATLTTADANGATVSLYVDQNKFKHSIHGRMFACVDCHKDVKSLAHDTPPEKVTCAQCHADAQEAYAHSTTPKPARVAKFPRHLRGLPRRRARDRRRGDPKSPVNHANIPATCGRCHGQKFLMESNGESAQPFISYQESVHGRAIANGSKEAAVCTDCHGTHEILPANDAKSPISKFNVPRHLRQVPHRCRQHLQRQHSRPGDCARQHALAPTCTDCHGIHSIKAHTDPNSPVSEQNVSRDTCARCHEGVRLSQEFGVPGNRVTTTSTAITAWPPKAARWWPPTAPVATACTTFCPRAIRAPPSIAPISTPPAASATRASRRSSRARRCIWTTGTRRTTSTPSPCAGCAGFTSS